MRKIFTILFLLVFIGIGIFVISKGNHLRKACTVEAIAKVVEIRTTTSAEDGDSYYPVLEYNANGQIMREESSIGSSNQEYQINDNVDILYNPENPKEFLIKGEFDIRILGIIFVVLGIFALPIVIIRP